MSQQRRHHHHVAPKLSAVAEHNVVINKTKKLVRMSLAERLAASREKRILEYRRRKVNEQRRKSKSGLAMVVESSEEEELEVIVATKLPSTRNSDLSTMALATLSPRAAALRNTFTIPSSDKLPYIFTLCVSLQMLLSYLIGSWRG